MTTQLATRPSALQIMAERCSVDPAKLHSTLKNTVFKGASDDEMLALVVTANVYELNPLLREIYGFPKKGGGIVPLVGVDGWIKIANRQENFDGMEVEVYGDGSTPTHATCAIYLKDRTHAVKITEYFDECVRGTEPWKQMPRRMLRNKAISQAVRVAFGVSGIFDEDEGKDIALRDVTPPSNAAMQAENPFRDAEASKIDKKPPAKTKGTRKKSTPAEKEAPAQEAEIVEPEPDQPNFPSRKEMVADIRETWSQAEITMPTAEAKYKKAGLMPQDKPMAELTDEEVAIIWNKGGAVILNNREPAEA